MSKKKKNKKKLEFSKTLLVQESILIWITTLAYIALAFYCIMNSYIGSLPWLTASASLPWAAYGVSQVFYYKKSTVENAKDGIKYESVLRSLDMAYQNQNVVDYSSCDADTVAADEIFIDVTDDTTSVG